MEELHFSLLTANLVFSFVFVLSFEFVSRITQARQERVEFGSLMETHQCARCKLRGTKLKTVYTGFVFLNTDDEK